jgi:hypothetical protein
MADSAIEVWNGAAKHYKTSYTAWISYTDALMFVYPSPLSRSCIVELIHTLEKTASSTRRARRSSTCT